MPGNTIAATGTLAMVNPFQFSTKYLDYETDLYYYGHRYYKPPIGRWLNRDPIGEMDFPNNYLFVGNTPSLRQDPFGLWTSAMGHIVNQLNSINTDFDTTYAFTGTGLAEMHARLSYALTTVWFAKFTTGVSYYDPTWQTIGIKWGDSPVITMHELLHAYNHNVVSSSMSAITDEGMAYVFQDYLYKGANRMKMIEKDAFSRDSCEERGDMARFYWTTGWEEADFSKGIGTYFPSKWSKGVDFPLSHIDVENVAKIFTFKLRCSDLAAQYTLKAKALGCCFEFSCDESGPSSPMVIRPSKKIPDILK